MLHRELLRIVLTKEMIALKFNTSAYKTIIYHSLKKMYKCYLIIITT